MDHVDRQILEAYLDGELDGAGRERVEAHVALCTGCARELANAQYVSRLLGECRFDDISDEELKRVHAAIDDAQDQRVWRVGGAMGLIAASILIVSVAWLNAIPASSPARSRSQMTVSAPAWEQVAMTLRAGPLPAGEANPQTGLADSTEAQLAEWMVQGLTGSPSPVPGKQMP